MSDGSRDFRSTHGDIRVVLEDSHRRTYPYSSRSASGFRALPTMQSNRRTLKQSSSIGILYLVFYNFVI